MSIYEIFGRDAHSMTRALMEAAQVADRIPAGVSVALKPNLVLASPPEEGATTHAGVLSGCISYLQEHGFQDISVMEGSWVGGRTDQAMRTAGYDKVCRRYGVPFYDLKQDETEEVNTPAGPIAICKRALHAGYLIDMPVLKGHCQALMTCALKNLKGCLPDREKRRFHAMGLMKPVAALACALRPQLTIVDSICGDLYFEEGGSPVQTNRMLLGFDPVQMDAYGCRLMGLNVSDVPYIGLAEGWGAGSTEVGDVVCLNEPAACGSYSRAAGKVASLTKHVRADSACSACYAALVRALYTTRRGGKTPIAIGQGWKGKSFHGLGIGRCCDCADRQVKGCPPTARAIAEALRER